MPHSPHLNPSPGPSHHLLLGWMQWPLSWFLSPIIFSFTTHSPVSIQRNLLKQQNHILLFPCLSCLNIYPLPLKYNPEPFPWSVSSNLIWWLFHLSFNLQPQEPSSCSMVSHAPLLSQGLCALMSPSLHCDCPGSWAAYSSWVLTQVYFLSPHQSLSLLCHPWIPIPAVITAYNCLVYLRASRLCFCPLE